jgi:hypothetical protein
MNDPRWHSGDGRTGFALPTTLLIILVLSVLALAAAWLASTERKTSFAEGVHVSALFSADAGTEGAINFLRLADRPPPIVNFSDMLVRNQGTTTIHDDQRYAYRCFFAAKRPRPGWGVEFLDYDYDIRAQGNAAREGRSAVTVVASRLFREGY